MKKKRKKRKKERRSLGWVGLSFSRLSPAPKWSVYAPSLSQRAAGPWSGNQNRIVSQDGENQSGPACLHMCVHVNVCVCEALTRTCHISYNLISLCSPCVCLFAAPLPLNTPVPFAHHRQPPVTTPRNPHMYTLSCWSRCYANSPLSGCSRGRI